MIGLFPWTKNRRSDDDSLISLTSARSRIIIFYNLENVEHFRADEIVVYVSDG
jgi:hypothetical protein